MGPGSSDGRGLDPRLQRASAPESADQIKHHRHRDAEQDRRRQRKIKGSGLAAVNHVPGQPSQPRKAPAKQQERPAHAQHDQAKKCQNFPTVGHPPSLKQKRRRQYQIDVIFAAGHLRPGIGVEPYVPIRMSATEGFEVQDSARFQNRRVLALSPAASRKTRV
jgi:hypothetical protein